MTAMTAAGLYVGLNLLILLVLGLLVMARRNKSQVGIGDGGDAGLIRASRAHANGSEWTPAALIGLVAAAALGAPVIAIHVLGGMLTVGRVLHGWGLSRNSGRSFGRVLGALLTLIVYIVLGAGLAVHALI
ncbi:MAPEG family protein [Hyphomonadaceae bacterium ML37]|nr:MAPEG family protein [Hyphomonadaceae bacterium ML37]